MGNKDLVTQKLKKVINEVEIHIQRVEIAFENLKKHNITFPLQDDIYDILEDDVLLAFVDQLFIVFQKHKIQYRLNYLKLFYCMKGKKLINLLEIF